MIYANLHTQVPVLPHNPPYACTLPADGCTVAASSSAQRPDCLLKWYDLSHLPGWLRSVPAYVDNGGGTLMLFAYERQGDAKVCPHTHRTRSQRVTNSPSTEHGRSHARRSIHPSIECSRAVRAVCGACADHLRG
mgnify:CR=1 FL=1